MPIYDYDCPQCGIFSKLNPMSRAQDPAPCPKCGHTSRRRISAPYIAGMPSALRQAHERNERSAHEPRTVRKSSCGCSGAHTCKPKSGNDAGKTPLQSSTRLNQRPWMLGH